MPAGRLRRDVCPSDATCWSSSSWRSSRGSWPWLIVPWPPFTDPAYYSLIAQRLAEGHGFTTPVLWSFIEVGSVIPDPAVLPVPSNAHWMPLTSIVVGGLDGRLRADVPRRHAAARASSPRSSFR